MNKIPIQCACGCGQPVNHPRHKFRKGHAGKTNVKGRNDPLDVLCAYCQEPIKVERWRIERFGADNVYCSRQHAGLNRSRKALHLFTCEQCGTEFACKRSLKAGAHVFCGLSCAATFRWAKRFPPVFVSCDTCGVRFRVPPSKQRKNKHFYCSMACRAKGITGTNNPSYRSGTGRHPYYGANWKKQRRATILRDGGACRVCSRVPKRTRYLNVHHIVPAYKFAGDFETANALTNLVCLCVTCHKKVESGKIDLPE